MRPLPDRTLVSQKVRAELRRWAPEVDLENRFPTESMDALATEGWMRFFVPPELGGIGGGPRDYVRVAGALGEECLSTALIWAMHCQQVAVMVQADHPPSAALVDIAESAALVASVTTEHGKGGALLQADAALEEDAGHLRVRRIAPIVSYGAQAKYFLVTMKSRRIAGVSLVLLERGDGKIEVQGAWNAMGMRGTQSVSMTFDATVRDGRVVAEPFRPVAQRCMIPYGHLGWSAAWLGCARGLYFRTLRHFREAGSRRKRDLSSEALRRSLAEVRLLLGQAEALVMHAVARIEELAAAGASLASYQSAEFQILINNLKVGVSRLSFEVADRLIQMCGLFEGYLIGSELGAERVFRDLRSASLMLNNDGLLLANGSFAWLEARER